MIINIIQGILIPFRHFVSLMILNFAFRIFLVLYNINLIYKIQNKKKLNNYYNGNNFAKLYIILFNLILLYLRNKFFFLYFINILLRIYKEIKCK